LYATETPGSDGKGFSAGRGGAGNVKAPANDGQEHLSDRVDDINVESVVRAPVEGEGFSTGRGGAANVHPQGAPLPKEETPEPAETNGTHKEGQMARLGLAYVPFCWVS
jgi:Protein of unknown function (DUF3602)